MEEFQPCPRDHAQQVRVSPGSVLCDHCVKQLERNLRALPALHRELLHEMSSTSPGTNPTRVSGSRRRDYLDMSMLDTRHDILTILESWSGIVVEERGTAAPARSVPDLVRFLLLNLRWLTAQPPAADFADEVESLHAESLRAIGPAPVDHNVPTMRCVVDGCHGTIDVSPRNTGGARKVASLTCTSGHSWQTSEWFALRQIIFHREGNNA